MNKFLEAIYDMIEIINGERPKQKTERAKGYTEEHTKEWLDWAEKPKRARGKKGRYKGDDLTTEGYNEAWVGGKAPKKRGKK